jgi:hypothetical protein
VLRRLATEQYSRFQTTMALCVCNTGLERRSVQGKGVRLSYKNANVGTWSGYGMQSRFCNN